MGEEEFFLWDPSWLFEKSAIKKDVVILIWFWYRRSLEGADISKISVVFGLQIALIFALTTHFHTSIF